MINMHFIHVQSYASILYLRLPQGFRIILRGKDVVHHNLVNDLMFTQEHTYKPHGGGDHVQKESNVSCLFTTELSNMAYHMKNN